MSCRTPVNTRSQSCRPPVGVSSALRTNVDPVDQTSSYMMRDLSTRPGLCGITTVACSEATDPVRIHKHPTPFELKLTELAQLKSQAVAHMRLLNALKVNYVDWFDRRQKTFVDALQCLQTIYPQCEIFDTNTIGNLKMGYEAAKTVSKKGCSVQGCATPLGEYLGFWDRLVDLHRQGQCVQRKIHDYCNGVREMKDPQLNEMVGQLQERINQELRENFNFMNIRGTSSDLFSYRVGGHDPRLRRLVAFIPHLLQTSTHICFLCNKMILEKD
ncbi:hypothetical protein BsWGS_17685 [Bradybaena similaris]